MEVTENIVPESEVKSFYENASKEIKIRQIVVKFDPSKESQKEEALKKAKKIVDRLKQKEAFSKIAEDESDDINTAKKGGDKGYLKWGAQSANDPVYVAAFSLKTDEISEPIETANAYYIIKVIHIRKYPAPPYEQEQERIKQRIYSLRRADIEKEYYVYLDELRRKYKLKFDEKNMELFVKKINEPKPENEPSKKYQPFDNFTDKEKQLALAAFSNQDIDITVLIDELKKIPAHRLPSMKSILEVQNFLNSRIVPVRLLEMEARAKNVYANADVKRDILNFKENLMMNYVQKKQIYDLLSINPDLVKKYYEENRDQFMNPEQREVQEIYVKDEAVARSIVNKARSGANFTSLFRRYNQKDAIKESDGKLGFISAGRGGIGKPAFAVEVGGVTDPIKLGDGYSIIKVLGKKAPEPKTFEEAENIASAKVRRDQITERESVWIAELKKKIDVVIYEKNLQDAMKNYIGPDIQTLD
ncbi:MAG: peptidylprolyl isomerase [Candidatus Zhuqueibacterota bacterium]